MMKDILKAFVYAFTGISEDDVDKLIAYIEDFFKNPKLYLNKGILYGEKILRISLIRNSAIME